MSGEIGASDAARRDRRALTRDLPRASRGERGTHAARAVVPRRGQDLRARAAVERLARALVQGPGRLAGDPSRSRAGAIFHSPYFGAKGWIGVGLDEAADWREIEASSAQLSAGCAKATRQARGVKRSARWRDCKRGALYNSVACNRAFEETPPCRKPPPRAGRPTGFRACAIDPFSLDFLRDPHPAHEALREAGPVVWLEKYGAYAAARHAEVRQILSDPATFCSSRGVGLSDFQREKPWRPPSVVLERDPPEHDRARARAQSRLVGDGDAIAARALRRGGATNSRTSLRERFASTRSPIAPKSIR